MPPSRSFSSLGGNGVSHPRLLIRGGDGNGAWISNLGLGFQGGSCVSLLWYLWLASRGVYTLFENREQISLTVYPHCGCPPHTGAYPTWVLI